RLQSQMLRALPRKRLQLRYSRGSRHGQFANRRLRNAKVNLAFIRATHGDNESQGQRMRTGSLYVKCQAIRPRGPWPGSRSVHQGLPQSYATQGQLNISFLVAPAMNLKVRLKIHGIIANAAGIASFQKQRAVGWKCAA